MADEITLNIDGQEVRTTRDQTIIEAALDAGIYIPYLCYHPGMKPFGACRMCVVEIEGGRGTPASCTVPVQEGMVVKTKTNVLEQVRRGIMDMLLAEHPHGCLTCHRVDLCGPQDICLRHVSVNDRCVTCPKNERCELKDTARHTEMDLNSPLAYQYRNLQIETKDPFYDRDYNLCIVCGRCVRVCEEVRGDNAITFTERAGQALVGTSMGWSLLQSGCEFCGACLDVCPVGALVERDHKWEKPVRVDRTVCPHCPVGCQLNLEVNKREKVVRAIPEINAPANRGQACYKGKFGLDFVNHKQRLRHPLIRRNGQLEEASWDEALSLVAQGLGQYKGSRYAALISPRNTNEEAYLLQKFARTVMESNNVDVSSNIRPDLAAGLTEVLGYAAATNTIWELEKSGCILAISTNTTEEHNVVGVPIKRAVKGDTKLIVIDSREVELTRYAHLWLRPRPGTDLALVGGILKVIIDENLVDQQFLESHCEGLEELKESLQSFDLDSVSAESGVSAERIQEAARLFAQSGPSAIIYALDNLPREHHRPCVHALADLALVTGNVGKPSAGLYPLPPGTNQQGAWDVGCVPHLLPGYEPVDQVAARERVQRIWKVPVPSEPGGGVKEMFQATHRGEIQAMHIVGDHANFTNGELDGVEEALEKLDFLVVQDTFLTSVAQKAHVVLPSCTFAEKEGTYTNLERRVQSLKRVFTPRNVEAQPDWWILCQLAQRMNAPGFAYASAAEVLEEIGQVSPIYGGISYQRLQAEAVPIIKPDEKYPLPTQIQYTGNVSMGLLWPCPTVDHPGTSILYSDGFPGGKAKLAALPWQPVPCHSDDKNPFLFVPGRVLAQPEREMEVVKTEGLNQVRRDEFLELHPEDARALKIGGGDLLEVVTNGHRVRGVARLVPEAQPGIVSATFLFGELAVQLDSSEDPDPMNKVPGLRIVPARVERVKG